MNALTKAGSFNQYEAACSIQDANSQINTAWLKGSLGSAFLPIRSTDSDDKKFDAIVIGAGLAGTTTAHALAEKGKRVLVIEKHDTPGKGGSGNPQGALYNKFSTEFNIQTKYALGNLLFSQIYYQDLQERYNFQNQPNEQFWSKCGLIQVAWNEKEQKKQTELLEKNDYPEELLRQLTPKQASNIAGVPIDHGGLFFRNSGWVAPKKLCQQLLKHPLITTQYNTEASSLKHNEDEGLWAVYDANENVINVAGNVVVCSASDAKSLSQLGHLRTKPIRGQVSLLNSDTLKEAKLRNLKTVLCGEGYISPAHNEQFCFGATFDLKSQQCDVIESDHIHNINQLTSWFTEAKKSLNSDCLPLLKGRASLRCTSTDYIPIVGKAPVYEKQIEQFAKLRQDAKHQFDCEGIYHEGLFVNIAHGSKGLSSCPLAAKFIASQVCNEISPFNEDILKIISPSRFLIRSLIRGKI